MAQITTNYVVVNHRTFLAENFIRQLSEKYLML